MMGEEEGDLLLRLATEVQRVAAGGTAADVQNAVLDQLAKLREEVAAREQEDSAGGAGGSPRPGAPAAGAQATAPAPQRQTRRSGSLQKQLEDKLAVDEAVQHADQADDQDLAACEAALQRLLAAWGDLKGLLRGVAEVEKLTQKRQKQQEEQEAAKMLPAKVRLETAVRALKEKLQRSRHLAAKQAVNRSLADVEEVLEAGDPAEIGDVHKQLHEQREVMTATAVELGDEKLNAITGLQITVDKSLRRLNRKRRELVRGTAAGSIFSLTPSEEGGDGGGDNALPIKFALPSAEEQHAISAEAGLSSSQLHQLLTTLAGGARSKLPPPSWPKFNDSYRSFFTFKDELEAFIKDYGQGTSDRTLAQQIKVNCLSKSSAAYVEWAHSPAAILETLGGLFGRPSRLVESLLEPVRKQKRIQMDDYPSLLAYFTTVRNVLQEVRRLNQMQLFNTVANMDLIVERLPTNELERWMEETEGLRDNQLASALERFVLERWRHCGTVVARTTTAEQALPAVINRGEASQPLPIRSGRTSRLSRRRVAALPTKCQRARLAKAARVRSPPASRVLWSQPAQRQASSSREVPVKRQHLRIKSRSGSPPRRPPPPQDDRLRRVVVHSSAGNPPAGTRIATFCQSAWYSGPWA
jgi:hypothetical protein